MTELSKHFQALLAPNSTLDEQSAVIIQLSKELDEVPMMDDDNVVRLIEIISTVWIEAETQTKDMTLNLDDVTTSCAQLFIQFNATYPKQVWPLSRAFIFVQSLRPLDRQTQASLRAISVTMHDRVFEEDSITAAQKEQLLKIADLPVEEKTELIRSITKLACRRRPSSNVFAAISNDLLVFKSWDMTLRYISALLLALGNCYISVLTDQDKTHFDHYLNLSETIMKGSSRAAKARDVLQYSIYFRVLARHSNAHELIGRLVKYKGIFDDLRDIILDANTNDQMLNIVIGYLDVIFNLALKNGDNSAISGESSVIDFIFSCLKSPNTTVQASALQAIVPVLEDVLPSTVIGKSKSNALLKVLEERMKVTPLADSDDLVKLCAAFSSEFLSNIKQLDVLPKYAPLLHKEFDGHQVQQSFLRFLQRMTFGSMSDPHTTEAVTMVHATNGLFDNILRLVKASQADTDVFALSFKVLCQTLIPSAYIITKLEEVSAQSDALRALSSTRGLEKEAAYFVGQLVESIFEQEKIEELISACYVPILERIKKVSDESALVYLLLALSSLAKAKDELNVKQVLLCATATTKDNENVLDLMTHSKLLFSTSRDVRCAVIKVIASLSTVPTAVTLLVNYGLLPVLVQIAMFDPDPCFQGLPCTPQYHAVRALNNMTNVNTTVQQTLRRTPMFLLALQQDTAGNSSNPIVRAKVALVAAVTRDDQPKEIPALKKEEETVLKQNPDLVITNTTKKEIVLPDDLFQTSKPPGNECNNPVCPNKGKRVKVMLCSGCSKVRYCSKECQQYMWPIHKNYCK